MRKMRFYPVKSMKTVESTDDVGDQTARRGNGTPAPSGKMPVILFLFSLFLFLTPVASLADAPPADSGTISADVFGHNAKWFHAHLAVAEAYDDNIFNTAQETESDGITILSPGLQLMVPAADQTAEAIVTNAATPGGLVMGRFDEPFFRRFRAYVGYAPVFQLYAFHPEENLVNHAAQAGVQYNLRSGYAIDLVDRYSQDYQRLEAGISPADDRFDSNLFNVIVTLPLTEKIRLKADYANYMVSYARQETASLLDRTDHSFTGRLYYRFMPKTALFASYSQIHMTYEDNDLRDNDARNFSAGITWNVTAKTRGTIRAGYDVRDYGDTGDDEELTGYIFQANIHYQVSSKTELGLRGYHRNEESYYANYDFTRTTAVGLSYHQALTYRIALDLSGWYRWLDYDVRDDAIFAPDRSDQSADVECALVYAFRKWLSAALSYQHRRRDSDIDWETFSGNTAMLTITGSI